MAKRKRILAMGVKTTLMVFFALFLVAALVSGKGLGFLSRDAAAGEIPSRAASVTVDMRISRENGPNGAVAEPIRAAASPKPAVVGAGARGQQEAKAAQMADSQSAGAAKAGDPQPVGAAKAGDPQPIGVAKAGDPQPVGVATGGDAKAAKPTKPALPQRPIPNGIDPSKPMVAFTFDDGPYGKVDNKILDVLAKHGGHVTFFMVGSRMKDYPDTIKRIYKSGCEIGNHTFNHKDLERLTPQEVTAQVEMTNDALASIVGIRTKVVRVPYGALKGQVPDLVPYPLIQWNVDTDDWKSKNASLVAQYILKKAKDGSIILMHDLYPASADAFALAAPKLMAKGYQLVTVSQLYAAKGITMEAGTVYFSASDKKKLRTVNK